MGRIGTLFEGAEGVGLYLLGKPNEPGETGGVGDGFWYFEPNDFLRIEVGELTFRTMWGSGTWENVGVVGVATGVVSGVLEGDEDDKKDR